MDKEKENSKWIIRQLQKFGLAIIDTKDKLHVTKIKGRQFLSAILLIGIACFIGFKPLYNLVNDPIANGVIGAAFGTIFVIIITMYLLNKQTEIEQETEKSKLIYQEKVELYKTVITGYEEILKDKKLHQKEWQKSIFNMIQLQMIAGSKSLFQYQEVMDTINGIYTNGTSNEDDGEDVELTYYDISQIMSSLCTFAYQCREDLNSELLPDEAHQTFKRSIETTFTDFITKTESHESDESDELDEAQIESSGKTVLKSKKPAPHWDGKRLSKIHFAREVLTYFINNECVKNDNGSYTSKPREKALTYESLIEAIPEKIAGPIEYIRDQKKPHEMRRRFYIAADAKTAYELNKEWAPRHDRFWIGGGEAGCKGFKDEYLVQLRKDEKSQPVDYALYRCWGAWNIADLLNHILNPDNKDLFGHVIEKLNIDSEETREYVNSLDKPLLSERSWLNQKVQFNTKEYELTKSQRPQFVLDVFKYYINNNSPSLEEFNKEFPAGLRTSAGNLDSKTSKTLILEYEQAVNESGWNTNDEDCLVLDGKKYCSSKQWSNKYFSNFYSYCRNHKDLKKLVK